ncbi:hypothetical protein LAC81_07010 [Ensifer adhaerens]|uniref:hypothetical protein n=1 Tax=Ensifer adhaerens TaxID=106592 RepID=UPI001CBE6B88|nr:hypothetical protein [Ensifer adhaerens]MBZ7921533.1 hypothetical protein [Ensifer adhaerens]UAX93957.1 hypothetical protein LAC78_07005 [Ensifer adhaerens]UAY01592.1 hypothetical protein LAC80_07010 [Ensifer adhaerens]UAY08975.1 hypothetical protein LAC81_07010 [Ensifer adhaerens]
MGKVLTFPKKMIAPVTVRNGAKHRISIEVRDAVRPRRTRWAVAAGRIALWVDGVRVQSQIKRRA